MKFLAVLVALVGIVTASTASSEQATPQKPTSGFHILPYPYPLHPLRPTSAEFIPIPPIESLRSEKVIPGRIEFTSSSEIPPHPFKPTARPLKSWVPILSLHRPSPNVLTTLETVRV